MIHKQLKQIITSPDAQSGVIPAIRAWLSKILQTPHAAIIQRIQLLLVLNQLDEAQERAHEYSIECAAYTCLIVSGQRNDECIC